MTREAMMIDPKSTAAGNLAADRIDLQLIADMVPRNSKVLDIGCGDGALLELLVNQRGVDGRGLELSQSGVNNCVTRGLSVVQGNADTDLSYYPDNGFDTVILSQTLQATQRPHDVLREMARIGKRLIVSIPNFGHWRVRLDLLAKGRMPVTGTLKASWYETANIHLCTLQDFADLCDVLGLSVESCITLSRGHAKSHAGRPTRRANLLADQGVFVLRRI
jgi:methionine biosynthesis protein MetW